MEQNQPTQPTFVALINHIKSGSAENAEQILKNSPSTLTNQLETQFRQPPLYFATLSNGDQASAELIKLLIRYGANVKYKDHNQQTILFYACRQGKQICTEILLSHGLSLDQIDVYGQTPIFYAVSENRIEIVRKYATKERINQVDKLVSQTPIYYAARRGHLDMCKLLLQKGADICHLDSSNKSASEYAKRAKFHQTADFLNNELKRIKQTSKVSSNSNPLAVDDSSQKKRKEETTIKQAKQTYRLTYYNENGQSQDLTQDQVIQLISQHPQLQPILTNPELIPQQQLNQSVLQSWNKVALKILNQCGKLKGAFYFLNPVDPSKYNIIDYFDIIQKPMDLGSVRKRLQYNCYRQASQFVAEMNLIWQNSYKYNGETHIVSKFAKELQQCFKQSMIAHNFDKYLKKQDAQE